MSISDLPRYVSNIHYEFHFHLLLKYKFATILVEGQGTYQYITIDIEM